MTGPSGESKQQKTVRLASLASAHVSVKDSRGDHGIGTAFHIGNTIYLTARHVLEEKEILEVVPYDFGVLFEDELAVKVPTLITTVAVIDGKPIETKTWTLTHSSELEFLGPFFHEDPNVDVAAFKLQGIDQNTPALMIGGHYDDWIRDPDWLLSTGVAFGYPPIPFTTVPVLVAATVEVNAIADTTLDRYVRFVVSGPPRGGFSGGPVYHEWGFVLGMITQSLEVRSTKPEAGFFTVLGIEALRECLEFNGLMPAFQKLGEELS